MQVFCVRTCIHSLLLRAGASHGRDLRQAARCWFDNGSCCTAVAKLFLEPAYMAMSVPILRRQNSMLWSDDRNGGAALTLGHSRLYLEGARCACSPMMIHALRSLMP